MFSPMFLELCEAVRMKDKQDKLFHNLENLIVQ